MSKKEIDDELKKADPEFLKKQNVDFDTVKFVVGYRWNKGGKEDEARECFKLFDKRDRNYINSSDLKAVLSNYLEFPVSEQDIQDFMNECDVNGTGTVAFRDFMKLYLS
jgi:Ca2+-binding EF-hand superfamily protein